MNSVKPNHPKNLDHYVFKHKSLPEHRGFTFVHLSDPHLFSPDDVRLRDILNKRMFGYLSWYLHRGREHRDVVLSALLDDMRSVMPDHIVVTGDLTHLGLPKEFLMAEKLLKSLGPPLKVMVIPGNHDTYIKTAWEQTFRLWSDYMASDADCFNTQGSGKGLHAVFPTLRVRKGIALIGVSTAHPTPPFFATGSIGGIQLERLKNILIETQRRGLTRVILIHHPPIPGAVSWRKRLTDQPAFQELIALHGADLILYGHTHHISSGHLTTPIGRVLSLGIPSATAFGRTPSRRARYHLFSLTQNADRLELFLSVRVYSSAMGRFVDEEDMRQIKLPRQTGWDASCWNSEKL
ncbi:MAG: metallophosphoesterase [Desulfosalsimonadaceae bacterium]